MLQRLFIFILLFLLLPDLYIYFRYLVKQTRNNWLRAFYWIPAFLQTVGLVYLTYYANNALTEAYTQAIGWFSIFFCLFTAPKLVFATCTVIGMPFRRWFHWPARLFIHTGLVLGAICAAVIVYGSFVGRTQYEVKEVTFCSPHLPEAFDGYRIVQLSDIHIGSWIGNEQAIEKLVQLTNAQKPDLIAFTGDLVNHRAVELLPFKNMLGSLKATDGVYSVLGNHDYGPYFHWESAEAEKENLVALQNIQAEMGWKLLNNEHLFVHRSNDSIAIVGVENEGEPPFSQHGDLPRALKGTEGCFQVLLSHNPTHWRREVLPQSDVELMLAGHTHGMQLILGNYSPSSHIYPEWSGLYLQNGRGLYVNIGIGYVGLPFRLGAWPEITVLTLKKALAKG